MSVTDPEFKMLPNPLCFSHPIADDNLQDFHEHRLAEGSSPFEVNYNLYSMVCHSGVLAGGHYVSYGKMGNQKWYCQNDSACKVRIISNMTFNDIFS